MTPSDNMQQELQREEELKRFKLLQENNKRNAQEAAEYAQLLKKYAEELVSNPFLLADKKETPKADYVAETNTTSISDMEKIVRNYEKRFDTTITDRENPTLSFKGKEESVDFFKAQSKQGMSFYFYCKEQDHGVYSDGKTFVQGTKAEIEAYKKNPAAFEVGEEGALKTKEEYQQLSMPGMN